MALILVIAQTVAVVSVVAAAWAFWASRNAPLRLLELNGRQSPTIDIHGGEQGQRNIASFVSSHWGWASSSTEGSTGRSSCCRSETIWR